MFWTGIDKNQNKKIYIYSRYACQDGNFPMLNLPIQIMCRLLTDLRNGLPRENTLQVLLNLAVNGEITAIQNLLIFFFTEITFLSPLHKLNLISGHAGITETGWTDAFDMKYKPGMSSGKLQMAFKNNSLDSSLVRGFAKDACVRVVCKNRVRHEYV